MRKVMAWFVPAGPATPMAARAGWAVMLGVWCGFVAGLNLPCWILVVLACCLRVPVRLFALALGGGWAGSVLAAPYSVRLGQWILHEGGLAERLAPYADSWLVPLLAADRFSQWGGLVLGSAAGVAAGDVTARAWRQLHRRQSPDQSARFFPGIRWQGCLAAVMLNLLAGAAIWTVVPRYLERELLQTLSAWTGSAVDVAAVRFDLIEGRLTIENLRVADPVDATQNRLQIGRTVAHWSPLAAWNGQWHAEQVRLEDVTSAAEFVAEASSSLAGDDLTDSGAAWQLKPYLRDPEAARRWGTLACGLVAHVQNLPGLEAGAADGDAGIERFWADRMRRCELGPARGRIEIGEVEIVGLPEAWGLGADATLELVHLSSRPAANAPPMVASGTAPQAEAVWQIQFSRQAEAAPQRISVVARHIPCEWVANLATLDPSVRVHQGALNLEARGTFDAAGLELAIQVETEQLGAELRGEDAVAGRSVATWNRCLQRTPVLELAARLSGAWSGLRLECDPQMPVEALRGALATDGQEESLAEFDGAPAEEPAATQVADAATKPAKREVADETTDASETRVTEMANTSDATPAEEHFTDEPAHEPEDEAADDVAHDTTLATGEAVVSHSTPAREIGAESDATTQEGSTEEAITAVATRPSHNRPMGSGGFRRLRESPDASSDGDVADGDAPDRDAMTEAKGDAAATPRRVAKQRSGAAPRNVVAAVPLDDPHAPMTAKRSQLSTPWGAAMPGRAPAVERERSLAQRAAPPPAIELETGYDYQRAPVPPAEVVADFRRRAAAIAAQEAHGPSVVGSTAAQPTGESARAATPVPQMARAARRSPVQAVPLCAEPASDAPFPVVAGRRGSNLGPASTPSIVYPPMGIPDAGPVSRTAGRPAGNGTQVQ